jgi:hypothetical protein
MLEPIPKFPTAPEVPKNIDSDDIWMGLRSKQYINTMKQIPGLYEKLANLKQGEVPNLSESDKKFFIDLVMNDKDGDSNLITDIANKIWGTHGIEWKQDGKYRQENIAAALWWHFCSSNRELGRVTKLVDFYLGTTKEQAEKEISTWKDWEGRTNIKLQ